MSSIFDQVLELPEESPKPQVVAPDRSRWPWYAGSYLSTEAGLAVIQVGDDGLTLEWNGVVVPLSAFGRDRYVGALPQSDEVVSVGFMLEDGGPSRYIYVNATPFKRIERNTAFVSDPALLGAFAGTYRGGAWSVTIRSDGPSLFFHLQGFEEVPCLPLDATRFACKWGLIELQPIDDGKVPTLKWLGDLILTQTCEPASIESRQRGR